ncbi:MAG: hypothetical protein ACI97A_000546 [Planctomycetota bacterium]|jgi:hypothetical protein
MSRFLVPMMVLLFSLFGCSEDKEGGAGVSESQGSSSTQKKQTKPDVEAAGAILQTRTLDLTTRTKAQQEAIAGVDVYAIPADMVTDTDYFKRATTPRRWLDRLKDAVATGKTGSDGKLQLAIPNRGNFQIIAIKGSLVADARIDPRLTSKLALDLSEDLPLRVRVVNSVGKPLSGVALGVCRTKTDPQVYGVRLSDKGGWVKFDHPKRWLQPASRSKHDIVIVGVAELFNPPVRKLVIGFDQSMTVELPPFGSVVLRCAKSESQSIVHLAVKFADKDVPLQVPRANPSSILARRLKSAQSDEVVFPYVGLDLPLVAQEQTTAGDYGAVLGLQAPGLAGDEATRELTATKSNSQIRFRLIGSGKQPLKHRLCELRIGDKQGRVTRSIVRSDADGRVQLPFLFAPESHSGFVEPQHVPLGLYVGLRTTSGRNARSQKATGAWQGNEFLVLIEDDHLIVAGTVKNGQGEALEHALIHLQLRQSSGYLGLKMGVPILTDQNGEFQIRARTIKGLIRVKTERYDHESAFSSNFLMGGDHLELRMEKKGRVTGQVLIDDLLRPRTLNVMFRESGKQKEIPYALRPDGKGNLKLDAAYVMPGVYDVVIVENDTVGRLHRIDGVRIPFRGSQEPKKLNPVDLAGKLRSLRLTVLDKKKQPIPAALVELSSPDGAPLSYRQVKGTSDSGIVHFIAPNGPLNASVRVDAEISFAVTIDSKVAKQTIQPSE